MPWFLKIAWNLLTGNLAGIAKAVTGTIKTLSDNDTARFQAAVGADKEVAIAHIQAAGDAWSKRVDLLKSMRVTQWLIAAALIPPLIHQGAIYLDTTPFPYFNLFSIETHVVGSWRVPKAPPPYDEREWLMISALLGIQSLVGVGMGALHVWRGK